MKVVPRSLRRWIWQTYLCLGVTLSTISNSVVIPSVVLYASNRDRWVVNSSSLDSFFAEVCCWDVLKIPHFQRGLVSCNNVSS